MVRVVQVGLLGREVDGLTLVLEETEQRLTAYAPMFKIYPGVRVSDNRLEGGNGIGISNLGWYEGEW